MSPQSQSSHRVPLLVWILSLRWLVVRIPNQRRPPLLEVTVPRKRCVCLAACANAPRIDMVVATWPEGLAVALDAPAAPALFNANAATSAKPTVACLIDGERNMPQTIRLRIYTGVRMNPQPSELRTALFRGFADRNRLRIIEQLTGGEQRVCDVVSATGLAQPNVSAHLSCLRDCGLVERERRGREVHYRLSSGVTELLESADAIIARSGEQLDACENYGTGRRRGRAAA